MTQTVLQSAVAVVCQCRQCFLLYLYNNITVTITLIVNCNYNCNYIVVWFFWVMLEQNEAVPLIHKVPSSSLCRWTDEHRGEEEEEAAQEQDHLQQQPAPSSGEGVWEDTLPRCFRQRRSGSPGQPHRG